MDTDIDLTSYSLPIERVVEEKEKEFDIEERLKELREKIGDEDEKK